MSMEKRIIENYKSLLLGWAGESSENSASNSIPEDELDELVRLGLARLESGGARKPKAVSPEIASISVGLAVSEQVRSAYEGALTFQRELADLHHPYEELAGRSDTETIEAQLLHSSAANRETVINAIMSAKGDIQLTLSPDVVKEENCLVETVQVLNALAVRGVRFALTCDSGLLRYPEFSKALDSISPAKGKVSIHPSVHSEIWCIDRSISVVSHPRTKGSSSSDYVTYVARSAELSAALHEVCSMMHRQGVPYATQRTAAISQINPTQRRIISLLCCGYRDEEIAERLNVSVRTVRRYVSQLLDELGARTRFQAALIANERGMVKRATKVHEHDEDRRLPKVC